MPDSAYVPVDPAKTGRPHPYMPVPADQKAEIVEDAKGRIMDGQTLKEIAEHHGVSKQALYTWLAGLGDEYQELRARWLDNMLVNAANRIEEADNALDLARGRELFRVATWHAERRDPQRYGQLANLPVGPGISIHLNMIREGKTIDAAVLTGHNSQTAQIEDVQPTDK